MTTDTDRALFDSLIVSSEEDPDRELFDSLPVPEPSRITVGERARLRVEQETGEKAEGGWDTARGVLESVTGANVGRKIDAQRREAELGRLTEASNDEINSFIGTSGLSKWARRLKPEDVAAIDQIVKTTDDPQVRAAAVRKVANDTLAGMTKRKQAASERLETGFQPWHSKAVSYTVENAGYMLPFAGGGKIAAAGKLTGLAKHATKAALPLLRSGVATYKDLTADTYDVDDEGNVFVASEGDSGGKAALKAAANAGREVAIEMAGGEALGWVFGKAAGKSVSSGMRNAMRTAVRRMNDTDAGRAVLGAAQAYRKMAGYTQFQGFIPEMFEEELDLATGVFGLDKKDSENKGIRKASAEYWGDAKKLETHTEIALGLLGTFALQGGISTVKSLKAEKSRTRAVDNALRMANVNDETIAGLNAKEKDYLYEVFIQREMEPEKAAKIMRRLGGRLSAAADEITEQEGYRFDADRDGIKPNFKIPGDIADDGQVHIDPTSGIGLASTGDGRVTMYDPEGGKAEFASVGDAVEAAKQRSVELQVLGNRRANKMKFVGNAAQRLAGNLDLDVFDSVNGLVQAHPELTENPNFNPRATGVKMPGGKIALVLDNIRSPQDALRTIMHEAGIHEGLRKTFGSKEAVEDFAKNVSGRTAEEFEARAKKLGYSGNKALLVEEGLAHAYENRTADPSTYQDAVSWLRGHLRKVNPKLSYSDSEIEVLMWEAQQSVMGEGGSARRVEVDTGAMEAAGREVAEGYQRREGERRDAEEQNAYERKVLEIEESYTPQAPVSAEAPAADLNAESQKRMAEDPQAWIESLRAAKGDIGKAALIYDGVREDISIPQNAIEREEIDNGTPFEAQNQQEWNPNVQFQGNKPLWRSILAEGMRQDGEGNPYASAEADDAVRKPRMAPAQPDDNRGMFSQPKQAEEAETVIRGVMRGDRLQRRIEQLSEQSKTHPEFKPIVSVKRAAAKIKAVLQDNWGDMSVEERRTLFDLRDSLTRENAGEFSDAVDMFVLDLKTRPVGSQPFTEAVVQETLTTEKGTPRSEKEEAVPVSEAAGQPTSPAPEVKTADVAKQTPTAKKAQAQESPVQTEAEAQEGAAENQQPSGPAQGDKTTSVGHGGGGKASPTVKASSETPPAEKALRQNLLDDLRKEIDAINASRSGKGATALVRKMNYVETHNLRGIWETYPELIRKHIRRQLAASFIPEVNDDKGVWQMDATPAQSETSAKAERAAFDAAVKAKFWATGTNRMRADKAKAIKDGEELKKIGGEFERMWLAEKAKADRMKAAGKVKALAEAVGREESEQKVEEAPKTKDTAQTKNRQSIDKVEPAQADKVAEKWSAIKRGERVAVSNDDLDEIENRFEDDPDIRRLASTAFSAKSYEAFLKPIPRREDTPGANATNENYLRALTGKLKPDAVPSDHATTTAVKVETEPGGDKTVSVPSKDKPSITPKEQKKFLLAEIDKAIEAAPDEAEESGNWSQAQEEEYKAADKAHTKAVEYRNFSTIDRKEWAKRDEAVKPLEGVLWKLKEKRELSRYVMVSIEVPGDGTFTIINDKTHLSAFRDKAKKFPAAPYSKPSDEKKPTPEPKAPVRLGRTVNFDALTAEVKALLQPFASTDPTRKPLLNPHWNGEAGEAVATDGRRLAVMIGKKNAKPKKDDSGYPNYTQVVPGYKAGKVPNPDAADALEVKVDSEKLARKLTQALSLYKDVEKASPTVKLWLTADGKIEVTTEFSETRSIKDTGGSYSSLGDTPGFELGIYNPEYLMDALTFLRKTGNATPVMRVGGKGSPMLLAGESEYVIQMPLRLDDSGRQNDNHVAEYAKWKAAQEGTLDSKGRTPEQVAVLNKMAAAVKEATAGGESILPKRDAANASTPAKAVRIIPYKDVPSSKIKNMEAMPRGTGARYLEVTEGENGDWIAKQWRRTPVTSGNRSALLDFNPPSGSGDTRFRRSYAEVDAARAQTGTPEFKKEYDAVVIAYKGTDKWLRAPNGKPTKLNERQWVQVRTPSFKAWFGDWEKYANGKDGNGVWVDSDNAVSKVVDDNGEPLVVFHGTTKFGFTEIDPYKADKHRSPMVFASNHYGTARSYSNGGYIEHVKSLEEEVTDEVKQFASDQYGWEWESDEERDALWDGLSETQKFDAIANYRSENGEEDMGRGVYPLFLNIRNPLESDFEGRNWDGASNGLFQVTNEEGEVQYDDSGKGVFTDDEAETFAKALSEKTGDSYKWEEAEGGETTNSVAEDALRFKNDGAIIRNVLDDGGRGGSADVSDVYVFFKAGQAKSALDNTGEFGSSNDIRFRLPGVTLDAEPVFFSQLRRTLEAKMPNRMTVMALRGLIDPSRSGVKADEIEWTGLKDFLDGKNPGDFVTKAEVLEATKDVEIQEVVKGNRATEEEIQTRAQELFDEALNETMDRLEEDGREVDRTDISNQMDWEEYVDAAREEDKDDTNFSQYQLPGGENYRELLLTLAPKETRQFFIAYKDGPTFGQGYATEDAARADMASEFAGRTDIEVRPGVGDRSTTTKTPENFKSSHFSEPNILAHVRFNERQTADGDKTLFLEEVQSDWHQAGREKGYAPRSPLTELPAGYDVVEKSSGDGLNYLVEKSGVIYGLPSPIREQAIQSALDELNGKLRIASEGVVPNAPFKDTSKGWARLAFKRMLRWAAENGFDRVAWTTGEQQAERYDLSKQVSRVEVYGSAARTYNVFADDMSGNRAIEKRDVPESELSGVIGKELATKAINSPMMRNEFTGLDLKVGGEGMRTFYDQILPSIANNIGKKFGARVEDVETFTKNDLGTPMYAFVHSLPVTPAMRESVMQGQPLFRRPRVELDADYLRAVERGDMETAQRMVDEAARRAFSSLYLLSGTVHPSIKSSYATDLPRMAAHFAEQMQSIGAPRPTKTGDGIVRVYSRNGANWKTQNEYILPAGATPLREYSPIEVREGKHLEMVDPTDAVTYDDAGNVIPLSQRFNEASDDIRFRRVGVTEQPVSKSLPQEIVFRGDAVNFGEWDKSKGELVAFTSDRNEAQIYSDRRTSERYKTPGWFEENERLAKEYDNFRRTHPASEWDHSQEFKKYLAHQTGSVKGYSLQYGKLATVEDIRDAMWLKFDRWLRENKQIAQSNNELVRQAKEVFDPSTQLSGLYFWQKTTNDHKDVWSKIMSPFLQSLGYDGIQYTEDNGGVTKALFASGRGRITVVPDPPDDIRFRRVGIPVNGPRYTTTHTEAKPGSLVARFTELHDAFRTKQQDYMLPAVRLYERVQRKAKLRDVPRDQDFIHKQRVHASVLGAKAKDIDRRFVDPMTEEVQKAGMTFEELHEYAAAVHAPFFNRMIEARRKNMSMPPSEMAALMFGEGLADGVDAEYLAEIIDNVEDGWAGQGLSDENAAKIVADFEAKRGFANLKNAHDLLISMNRNALETRVNAGLMSRAQADTLLALSPFYVPLHVAKEEEDGGVSGGGRNLGGREFKRAVGHFGKENVNSVAQSIIQAYQAEDRALENEARRALADFLEANPDDSQYVITGHAPKKAVTVKDKDGTLRVVSVPRQDWGMKREHPVVTFKRDGARMFIEFRGERKMAVTHAVKGDNVIRSEFLSFLNNHVMRFFKVTRTALNPEFFIPNISADFGDAMVNLTADGLNRVRDDVIKHMPHAWKIIFEYNRGHGALEGKRRSRRMAEAERFLKEAVANGMMFDSKFYNDTDDVMKDLEKRLQKRVGGKTNPMSWLSPREDLDTAGLPWILAQIDRLNSVGEMGTRLSIYMSARKNGLGVEQAVELARNVTVDFHRKGEWTPVTNTLYAFSNVGIQATYRMGKAILATKSGHRVAGGLFAAGFLSGLIGALLKGDDDDDENGYGKLEEWWKQGGLVLPNPFTGNWVRLRMRGIPAAIIYAGMRTADTLTGYASPMEAAVSSTVGFVDSSFNFLGTSGSVAQLLMPTLADPFIQSAENKDAFGNRIVPASFNKNKPDSEQYRKGTSNGFVNMSRLLNSMSGGDSFTAGGVDVSPETLRHWTDFIGGGTLKFVTRSMSAVESALRGEEMESSRIPIVRSFVFSPSDENRQNSRYYEAVNEFEEARYRLKGYTDARDRERKSELIKAHPYVRSGTADRLLSYSNRIKKLRELEERTGDAARRKELAARRLELQTKYIRLMRGD